MFKRGVVSLVILAGLTVILMVIIRPRKEIRTIIRPFGEGKITEIRIGTLVLAKNQQEWTVKEGNGVIPADRERSELIADRLEKLELDEVISINPKNFDKFGLENEKGLEITAGGRRLIIGNLTADYTGSYIWYENRIFRINQIWNNEEMKQTNYWANKKVTDLALDVTTKIHIKSNKLNKDMVVIDGRWDNENLAKNITQIEAISYLSNPPAMSETVEINIEGEAFREKVLVGKDWASRDGKNYYQIEPQLFQEILKYLKKM